MAIIMLSFVTIFTLSGCWIKCFLTTSTAPAKINYILDYAVKLRKPAVITATYQQRVVLGSHLVMYSDTIIVPPLRLKLNTFLTQDRSVTFNEFVLSPSTLLDFRTVTISSKEYKL
jgi:hypothetical protein